MTCIQHSAPDEPNSSAVQWHFVPAAQWIGALPEDMSALEREIALAEECVGVACTCQPLQACKRERGVGSGWRCCFSPSLNRSAHTAGHRHVRLLKGQLVQRLELASAAAATTASVVIRQTVGTQHPPSQHGGLRVSSGAGRRQLLVVVVVAFILLYYASTLSSS